MEFIIEQHSPVPVITQIQEQVKLAVWMGTVRSGDSLPSIREVERKTGVNRAQVYRAYKGLQQAGLLVLTRGRGKGAIVSTAIAPRSLINKKCWTLTKNLPPESAGSVFLPPHTPGILSNKCKSSSINSRSLRMLTHQKLQPPRELQRSRSYGRFL